MSTTAPVALQHKVEASFDGVLHVRYARLLEILCRRNDLDLDVLMDLYEEKTTVTMFGRYDQAKLMDGIIRIGRVYEKEQAHA